MNPLKPGDMVVLLRDPENPDILAMGIRHGSIGTVVGCGRCPCGMCNADTQCDFGQPPQLHILVPHSWLRKIDEGREPARWEDCVWQPEELVRQQRIDEILEHS